MKTGLIIEGDGVRGIYAAGVLDAFLEQEVKFDGVVGVSAGAIHGCSYLSHQKGRSLRYYMKYCNDPRFMSLRSWITTGDIVGAEFCYHELPDKLDIYDHETFLKNKTPFFVTCSNVETGKAEYIQITDMKEQIDYLRASASLPYFSRIVEMDGKKYLDGGVTDSIPLTAFEEMGYMRNVLILTRDITYRKKKEFQFLPQTIYRKYPKFADALLKRHILYNENIDRILEKEQKGEIFVIRPSEPLTIGRMEKDSENVKKVYDIGYSDAYRQMEDLKKFLFFARNK